MNPTRVGAPDQISDNPDHGEEIPASVIKWRISRAVHQLLRLEGNAWEWPAMPEMNDVV